ncbi:hypothetical protein P3L10_003560 [Capsicum annuum]
MTRTYGRLFGGVIEGKIRAVTPAQVFVRSSFLDMENPESLPPSSTPSPSELNFGPLVTRITKVASSSTPSSTHLM